MKCFPLVWLCLISCGHLSLKKNSDAGWDGGGVAYFASSISECVEDPEGCLVQDLLPPKPTNLKLVRSLPTSEVFKESSFEKIDSESRFTLEAAAIAETIRTAAKVIEVTGITDEITIDPLCMHPSSQHNGFYRPYYGTEEKKADHFICLGYSFSEKGGLLPLGIDPGIIAHELFHVLFSQVFRDCEECFKLVLENHDLESFNEGWADHFANIVQDDFDPWILKRSDSTWRTRQEAANLTGEIYGHIYRDGGKWRALADSLQAGGFDTAKIVQCSLENLSQFIRQKLSEESWHRIVSNKDILDNLCLQDDGPSKQELSYQYFKYKELSEPIEQVDLAVVAVTNERALCAFQAEHGLHSEGLQRYQSVDGCQGFSSLSYKGEGLSLADTELSRSPGVLRQPIWVGVGIKPAKGKEGVDCKLRGDTAFYSEVGLGADGSDKVPFTNLVPRVKRGSWYRDIPFGNLKPYPIGGLFKSFEDSGFIFTSYDVGKEMKHGLNGLFLLPSFILEGDQSQKRAKLTERLKAVFGTFHRDQDGGSCSNDDTDCFSLQNFFLECQEPKALVTTRNVEVGIFDCESGEGECDLKLY